MGFTILPFPLYTSIFFEKFTMLTQSGEGGRETGRESTEVWREEVGSGEERK